MKERGVGSFTMKVDQNPLAKNPNEGVAQRDPITKQVVRVCIPPRHVNAYAADCRARRSAGETDAEVGKLPTWVSPT